MMKWWLPQARSVPRPDAALESSAEIGKGEGGDLTRDAQRRAVDILAWENGL
jgi:hypothetical protein